MTRPLLAAVLGLLIVACQPPPNAAQAGRAPASGIETRSLSPVQVENLALLGEVWGFAKYHHPRVARGGPDWDSALFEAMPAVLEAPDRAAAARGLAGWLDGLGEVEPCSPCATLPDELHLRPDVDWIHDADALGDELSRRLVDIHRNRPAGGEQHFVSFAPGVGNPVFSRESGYARLGAPDAGYRLLALFRFWNIIRYWFPYRDVIGEDWAAVLREFVPRVMEADGPDDYRLAMLRLIARVHDGHANLWSHLPLQPPRGAAQLPLRLRFVEGRAVVTGYLHPELGPASGLRVGDVIDRLDGDSVDSLVAAWRPYYPASNEAARLRDVARNLTRGDGPLRVTGVRDEGTFELTARRVPLAELGPDRPATHDLPGATFRMLDDDVAYLKLSSVRAAAVPGYVRRARRASVLVVDIRNYPSEFVAYALGGRLLAEPAPFARVTHPDPANPGAFRWGAPLVIPPLTPRFAGRVVILVDETTQSQAEYTAMALRTAPGALVVGSTTAGTDGNASPFLLPGGLRTRISGIGIFYPDRTPTQRVGIVPDLEVRPTLAGIRAGRDEVLEAAVSHALGREFRLPPQQARGR